MIRCSPCRGHPLQEQHQRLENSDITYTCVPGVSFADILTCTTVWPEILAEIYFGRLLKFLCLAEVTLAVWQGLCHNDIHSNTHVHYHNLSDRTLLICSSICADGVPLPQNDILPTCLPVAESEGEVTLQ